MTSELKQRKLSLAYTVEGKFNIDIEYVSESGGGVASNFLEVASKQSKICREERFWRDEVADKVLYSSSLESLLPFTTRADRPHRTQIVASTHRSKSKKVKHIFLNKVIFYLKTYSNQFFGGWDQGCYQTDLEEKAVSILSRWPLRSKREKKLGIGQSNFFSRPLFLRESLSC